MKLTTKSSLEFMRFIFKYYFCPLKSGKVREKMSEYFGHNVNSKSFKKLHLLFRCF